MTTKIVLSGDKDGPTEACDSQHLWKLGDRTLQMAKEQSLTCIQFNPVDDRYYISGSLDAKARIWSIPDRQVVDWNDLHEMVTAASYTPDGQGALVGTYKGSCRQYNTSENKLQQKGQINLRNKRRKSHLKKITGFQFASENSSEVLITSADSRIRVVDGVDVVHKFKVNLYGFCASVHIKHVDRRGLKYSSGKTILFSEKY
ncbi:WD repeat-containing protein [Drosera capensis]